MLFYFDGLLFHVCVSLALSPPSLVKCDQSQLCSPPVSDSLVIPQ